MPKGLAAADWQVEGYLLDVLDRAVLKRRGGEEVRGLIRLRLCIALHCCAAAWAAVHGSSASDVGARLCQELSSEGAPQDGHLGA